MSYETLGNAIRSRFDAQVGAETDENSDAVTIQYDNAPVDPPDDATWIRCSILWGERQRVSLGSSPRYRVVGVLVASIFAIPEAGDQFALELAGVIEEAFRSVTAGGVTYRTPTVRSLGRQGSKWQVNVECPFYADEIPS